MFCHKFYIQLCVRFFHSLTFPIQKINFLSKMNNFPENDDKTKKKQILNLANINYVQNKYV